MYRVLVVFLAALDALVTGAVGIAVVLAPLTLVWVFALAAPAWGDLWPTTAIVWQLGHLVPVSITLPAEYLAVNRMPTEAATFVLSLAPLAFAVFTAWSAARSGVRAARAGAWCTGALTGSLVFAALAAAVAVTSSGPIASVDLAPAIVLPGLVYLVPAFAGAVIGGVREGDEGILDSLAAWVERWPETWRAVPGLALLGLGVVVAGLVAVGAAVVLVAVVFRGSQAITLFQASNADALGATVLALGQFLYLPTLIVWALAFAAGPGFALGAGAAVAPGGGQLGVVPGIPVLALIPPDASSWYLLLVLLPIGVGALAGGMLRGRMIGDAVAPRLVLSATVALLSALTVALLALVSSGSMGPGSLAHVGPAPGALALAIGLEVLVGCGILLLSPRAAEGAGLAREEGFDRPAREIDDEPRRDDPEQGADLPRLPRQ